MSENDRLFDGGRRGWWAGARKLAGPTLPELFFEPLVDAVADVVGEVVAAVGVFDDELILCFEQVEDGLGSGDALADALVIEVVVVERRVHINAAGGDGGEDLVEVEGHLVGIVFVNVADLGHVAVAGPAFEVALVIVVEACEAAACDDGFESRLEDGGEECVVATERMANDADVVDIDVAECFEEVDGADVVPDGLHGATGVERQFSAGRFLLEVVGFVIAEAGVVGNQADEAALGELMAVMARRPVTADEAGGLGFTIGVGGMQTEHGGQAATEAAVVGGGPVAIGDGAAQASSFERDFLGNEEKRGDAVAGLGGVCELEADVFGSVFAGFDLYVERNAT